MTADFNWRHYHSLADLVTAHRTYLSERFVFPFLNRIHASTLIGGLGRELDSLRYSFLNRDPVIPKHYSDHEHFRLESQKKDLGSQIRRFALGS